jgi:hypothetical protein
VRLSVAVLLLALAVAPAAAEDTQVFDLGTQAPVAGNKTWRDLLGLLFPDLRQEPGHDGKTGDFIHGKVDIRPIDKEAFEDYCPDTPLRIEYINFKQVEIDGQMRLIVAITTDGDACFGALALFSNQFEARLLDVVNIQQDGPLRLQRRFRPLPRRRRAARHRRQLPHDDGQLADQLCSGARDR